VGPMPDSDQGGASSTASAGSEATSDLRRELEESLGVKILEERPPGSAVQDSEVPDESIDPELPDGGTKDFGLKDPELFDGTDGEDDQ